jgi:hypothetical protein
MSFCNKQVKGWLISVINNGKIPNIYATSELKFSWQEWYKYSKMRYKFWNFQWRFEKNKWSFLSLIKLKSLYKKLKGKVPLDLPARVIVILLRWKSLWRSEFQFWKIKNNVWLLIDRAWGWNFVLLSFSGTLWVKFSFHFWA